MDSKRCGNYLPEIDGLPPATRCRPPVLTPATRPSHATKRKPVAAIGMSEGADVARNAERG